MYNLNYQMNIIFCGLLVFLRSKYVFAVFYGGFAVILRFFAVLNYFIIYLLLILYKEKNTNN